MSLLLLTVLLLESTSAQDSHYVKPNNCMNCYSQPCLSLDQYAEEKDRYFTSGSTFLFLVGNHSLKAQVNLTSISHITLRGKKNDSDSVNIICTSRVIFRFENATGIKIEGLTFLLQLTKHITPSALVFINSKEVSITTSVFQGSEDMNKTSAWAVFSHQSDIIITDSLFEGNTGSKGGAIKAQGHGGNITLDGNKFIRNKALYGGAIFCSKCLIVIMNGNSFIDNSCEMAGGALTVVNGNLSITDDAHFCNNKANAGGAIYLSKSDAFVDGSNITFSHNVAGTNGGAIFVQSSRTIMQISANFESNKGEKGAALYLNHANNVVLKNINIVQNSKQAVYIIDSSVGFNGTNVFCENLGVLTTTTSSPRLSRSKVRFNGNNIFENNEGGLSLELTIISFRGNTSLSDNYGFAIFAIACDITFTGCTVFRNNSALRGGVVDLQHCPMTFHGTTMFINNVGKRGSINNLGMTISFRGDTTFINNTAETGGAIDTSYGDLIFANITTFINNSATTGGVINTMRGSVSIRGISTFAHNTAEMGGAIYTAYDNILFAGAIIFTNNTAHEDGGAIYVLGSRITLRNTIIFSFNSAMNGGAMYLTTVTTLSLASNVDLITSHNRAADYGGAIYHKDNTVTLIQCSYFNGKWSDFEQLPECFLELLTWEPTINIVSYLNSAGKDGSFIYGGLLDKCRLDRSRYDQYHDSTTFMNLLNVTSPSSDTKAVGSEPFQLSLCNESVVDINNTRSMTVTVHRGQLFSVSLIAFGQGHIVTSTIVTALASNSSRLELSETIQPLPKKCSRLTYRLYSIKNFEELVLYPDGPCRDTGLAQVIINVTLLPCPDTFTQAGAECICEKRLQVYNTSCTIGEVLTITRRAGSKFWMSTLYVNGSYKGLILYKSCPTDYCKTGTVSISLDNLNSQCDLNRSGVLCGACATNYSLLLGSSQCAICSNKYLALLVPFVLAGLALVVLLTSLKLTVATGMINSLILYANFVQVNRKLFFPANKINILTVFIAWMNLDFGFEICFFAGMDAYAETWLQYAFPIYVWVLIGLIILSCRYSITISKLVGSNPIAVLATLLLMSYTKILKIVIEVFSFIDLDYPNGQKVTVWLKDANLLHLGTKHLLLTVVTSLVFVFIFLPYTVFLLLGHKLYRLPCKKRLRWLYKFKPLLDSYYAPYNRSTRYWTGFLLLVRCALYIVFSFNSLGATNNSLLAIIITFTGIAILASGRIYKKIYVDIMEEFAYFNLVILSAGTLAEVNKAALSYTLVGIMFATMLGTIVYHFHLLYIAKSAIWLKVKSRVSFNRQASPGNDSQTNVTTQFSKTVIELREPLLEDLEL